MAIQLPARIGKYELEEFLGGGMSHVYRARDTVIGRTVAIKVLTEEGCSDAETKARFLQEARMAGNIEHENVIAIYDFGEDDQNKPFMVMEFLRGEDLRHVIKGGRLGDLRNRLRIALQVARALGFVHTQKIVHRDIKPENIHITPAGLVKLMDFGIAKTEGFSMTRTGYVMGTPYYMAPEQVLGKNIGDKVDIYAFGVMFYELITGTKPVTGESVERIFYSILHEPLDLGPLRDLAPPAALAVIARCTAKDPAERPANFGEVAQEIETIIAQLDGAAAPAAALESTGAAAAPEEEAEERKRTWMPIAIGAVLLLGLAGAIAFYLSRNRHTEVAKATTPAPTLSTPTGEMVLVPAGPFLYGKNLQSVTLPAYYIDQTEVRNTDYQSFAKATGHALPDGFAASQPDLPVVNVAIDDARQFARWAGKRLPTNEEWEKAARGPDGLPFPWGKDSDAGNANVRDNRLLRKHDLMPVRSFESGASPFHAVQMVGNVWEFVEPAVTPSPEAVRAGAGIVNPPAGQDEPWYRIRGESYQEPLSKNVMWDWGTMPARYKGHELGFRCVKDPPGK